MVFQSATVSSLATRREIEFPQVMLPYDFNDLKLDNICNTLRQDIKNALAFGADDVLLESVSAKSPMQENLKKENLEKENLLKQN